MSFDVKEDHDKRPFVGQTGSNENGKPHSSISCCSSVSSVGIDWQ
jgi:hypothetical protein